MRCLFTICGRAGSKGIKNKNIREFIGFPLPLYSLAVIELFLKENIELEADRALNTDSEELVRIMTEHNKDLYVVSRKESLAGDRVAKKDVIIDTLIEMESITGKEYDVAVDLDITSPLRTVQDLKNLIEKLQQSECDVVFSAVPSRRNPYFNMVKRAEKGYEKACMSTYTTRQEAPEMFDMNASLYAYRAEHLKAGKGVLEGYNEMIEMYDTGVLDLDHENDFGLMQIVADYLYHNKPEFMEVYQYMESKW